MGNLVGSFCIYMEIVFYFQFDENGVFKTNLKEMMDKLTLPKKNKLL